MSSSTLLPTMTTTWLATAAMSSGTASQMTDPEFVDVPGITPRYLFSASFGRGATWLSIQQEDELMWNEGFPGLLDASTIRLLLEHAGWRLFGKPENDTHGWFQTVVPVL
jgi:hypothetical protein